MHLSVCARTQDGNVEREPYDTPQRRSFVVAECHCSADDRLWAGACRTGPEEAGWSQRWLHGARAGAEQSLRRRAGLGFSQQKGAVFGLGRAGGVVAWRLAAAATTAAAESRSLGQAEREKNSAEQLGSELDALPSLTRSVYFRRSTHPHVPSSLFPSTSSCSLLILTSAIPLLSPPPSLPLSLIAAFPLPQAQTGSLSYVFPQV